MSFIFKKAPLGAFALLAFLWLLPTAATRAEVSNTLENRQIEIAYIPPKRPELRPVYDDLVQRGVLEELRNFLAPLRLPRAIKVQTDECGGDTRPYVSGGAATICYELVAKIAAIAAEHAATDSSDYNTALVGTFTNALLHEVALEIFDVLQVPVWGRYDDAADRLTAFIMLQFGEDIANTTISGVANFFTWSNQTWSGRDFEAAASPNAQRFYNFLCIAYAGEPHVFGDLVQKGVLPESRAGRCRGEYEQIRKAFNLRIMPYIDPDLLIKARAVRW